MNGAATLRDTITQEYLPATEWADPRNIAQRLAVVVRRYAAFLDRTPTLVDLRTITPGDYAVLVSLTVITLVIVLVPYLALAAKARWFLQTPRALKTLNRTAAAFMMGAAAAIAARQ